VSVYALDPVQDPRWPDLVARHPDSSVFHSQAWLGALRRTYGYKPIAYTTSPAGTDLKNGVVFCQVDSWLTGRRLVSLPFSDHSEPLVDSAEDLHTLLALLRCDPSANNWKYIEIRPLRRSVEDATGFSKAVAFHFHRLDLRPPIETLLRGFHKSAVLAKIRRAEREDLTYEAGRSEALLRTFYELLLMTCRRRRLPPQPIDWFRHVLSCLGDGVKVHVASKDGRPVASILTLAFKRTLVYKYGCSDARLNALGGMQLLFWKAIQAAKRDGLDEFDLGRSEPDARGLVTFKDRWGTARSLINYFRCPAAPRLGASTAWSTQIAKSVFGRMPGSLLATAGKMLYRHVG
jgi:hypothetical protein